MPIFLNESMTLNGISGGVGVQFKKPSMGGVWILSGTTQLAGIVHMLPANVVGLWWRHGYLVHSSPDQAMSLSPSRGGRNRIGRREKWPKQSWEEGEIGGKSREEGEKKVEF